jgi:hypothetical protein
VFGGLGVQKLDVGTKRTPVPTIEVVPPRGDPERVGCVSPVMERALAGWSRSVSVARTLMVRLLSSDPVHESFVAIGRSFIQVTVMVMVVVLLPIGQKVSLAW